MLNSSTQLSSRHGTFQLSTFHKYKFACGKDKGFLEERCKTGLVGMRLDLQLTDAASMTPTHHRPTATL